MERSEGLLSRACVAIATGFYLSYIPARLSAGLRAAAARRWTGAGFIGTVLGWAALPLLPEAPVPYAAVAVAGIAAACWICGKAEEALGTHDDPRICLDETVGYWAAAAFLPRTWGWLLAAFLLFRVLDAVKLPPYRWLERLPGGAGVVMDDVGAGLAANAVLQIAYRTFF